eukprot:3043184-Prymnesium_polylepis.1
MSKVTEESPQVRVHKGRIIYSKPPMLLNGINSADVSYMAEASHGGKPRQWHRSAAVVGLPRLPEGRVAATQSAPDNLETGRRARRGNAGRGHRHRTGADDDGGGGADSQSLRDAKRAFSRTLRAEGST